MWWSTHLDAVVRMASFASIFAVMAVLEHRSPKRKIIWLKSRRWTTNLAIVALDSALLRLMALSAVPVVAIAAADFAASRSIGLFNVVPVPAWIAAAISIVALDFALWLQHVASHKLPALWRLHRMHHADTGIDLTTGIRFHPVEVLLSMLWKSAWVVALGAPAPAVLAFEIILNGCALFNHANTEIGASRDRWLRCLLVTPDMHRVHHSSEPSEHNANFGFNLPFWDRIFGTYRAQPAAGHQGMTIGLGEHQSEQPSRLLWSLTMPFRPTSARQSDPSPQPER